MGSQVADSCGQEFSRNQEGGLNRNQNQEIIQALPVNQKKVRHYSKAFFYNYLFIYFTRL